MWSAPLLLGVFEYGGVDVACQNMDATIFLENPPDIHYEGGIFYITDRIGSLTIRRCLRASTFAKLVLLGTEAVARWRVDQLGKVERLR